MHPLMSFYQEGDDFCLFFFPWLFLIYNFWKGYFFIFHLPFAILLALCYFPFPLHIQSGRPEKASFHSESPRISFFGLQSLSSILLLMLLCETVCWIVLRKQCTFSNLLGEMIVALKRRGNNESMFSK